MRQTRPALWACLLAGAVHTVSAESVTLEPSAQGNVCILLVDGKPQARSYDGHPWERTQGGGTLSLDPVNGVANIPTGSTHRIETYEGEPATAQEIASRFLMQSSFGPTRSTIAQVDASTEAGVAAWLAQQMALPPTLHRAYYRRRANPRLFRGAVATGGERTPCEPGSRWHRFALTKADEGAALSTVPAPYGGLSLKLGSARVRTEVSGANLTANETLRLCSVEERVGGLVELGETSAQCTSCMTRQSCRRLESETAPTLRPPRIPLHPPPYLQARASKPCLQPHATRGLAPRGEAFASMHTRLSFVAVAQTPRSPSARPT